MDTLMDGQQMDNKQTDGQMNHLKTSADYHWKRHRPILYIHILAAIPPIHVI